MIRVGIIGYGYWGPRIARNFQGLNGCELSVICDKSAASLKRAAQANPSVSVTADAQDVLRSKCIDAVAVITPVWTHFELAKAALENGKHVFVEKPFTSTVAQAEELIELAARKNLQIMVDHTFLFTGAVKKIRQLIDDGALGKLYYYDSTRVNLGLFQHDVNVIWDLAPHDLSIMDHLISAKPEAVVATGQKPLERPRRRRLHHRSTFPDNDHRAHQRELALAGQGADHADRRREEDAGVERSGGGREDEDLRQGRRHHQTAKASTTCWSAIGRATCGRPRWSRSRLWRSKRSISSTASRTMRRPFNDGVAGPAGGADARSGRPVSEAARERPVSRMNDLPVHSAGCEAGRERETVASSSICMAARSETTPRSARLSKSRRTPRSARTARSPATPSSARA